MPGEAKCRDCGADVIWFRTKKTGKNILMDAERSDPDKESLARWEVDLDDESGETIDLVPAPERMGMLLVCHWDTCQDEAAVARREADRAEYAKQNRRRR